VLDRSELDYPAMLEHARTARPPVRPQALPIG